MTCGEPIFSSTLARRFVRLRPFRGIATLSALLLSIAAAAAPAAKRPPAPTQKKAALVTPPAARFVTSICFGAKGQIWIGCEPDTNSPHDGGVWRFDPSATKGKQWTQYTVADGLGDNSIYAIARDRVGRIWVGHLNHGVSVFNGRKWQNYDVVGGLSQPPSLSGPIGERVFHIAVDPKDGDVWIATNAGLTRYSESKDTWTYYTRANGLPSDEASSIAFDPYGNIYVATQCDGIAMANFADNYSHWRTATAPADLPLLPRGEGLSSNLTNDVLVGRNGTAYVATDAGLCWSNNHGQSWNFLRGQDWAAKVRGRIGGAPLGWRETRYAGCLAEDYITCLAEDDRGLLWIGHRQKGCEVFDTRTGKQPSYAPTPSYVTSLLATDGGLAVGTYGDGMNIEGHPAHSSPVAAGSSLATTQTPSLPTSAPAPTLPELNTLLYRIREVRSESDSQKPMAIALDDDWRTQGNWLGRYGRYWAVLCAIESPFDYIWGAGPMNVPYLARIGAHHAVGDRLRYWISRLYTTHRRTLEMPPVYFDSRVKHGYATPNEDRRQASWDDHGEVYAPTHQGPDVYCNLQVPRGGFVLSLYIINKDGHSGRNVDRDYEVSLRLSQQANLANVPDYSIEPNLAHGRIVNFWSGLYKRFWVRGPATLSIKLNRNYSFNTILSGIMLDQPVERPWPYFTAAQRADLQRELRPTKITGPSKNAEDAVRDILAELAQQRHSNPKWWAMHHHRLAVLLGRWCQAQLNNTAPPKSMLALEATCFYQAGYCPQWEACQHKLGLRTAREIEKSQKWNKAVGSYSGRGRLTVMAYTKAGNFTPIPSARILTLSQFHSENNPKHLSPFNNGYHHVQQH